ncbi:hypothetical protein D3C72_1721240 [compost metagenome]
MRVLHVVNRNLFRFSRIFYIYNLQLISGLHAHITGTQSNISIFSLHNHRITSKNVAVSRELHRVGGVGSAKNVHAPVGTYK